MNEEWAFWKYLWKLVLIFMLTFVVMVVGCNIHTNECIRSSIENGADPLESYAAFAYSATGEQRLGTALAQLAKEKKNKDDK